MPVFIGFNTIDVCKPAPSLSNTVTGGLDINSPKKNTSKKFRLTDTELVIRDFLNALNIRRGEKVGRPEYGSLLHEYLFDPNTVELRTLIDEEIRRVASNDPRLIIETLDVYNRENGILVEMEVRILPFNNIVQVGVLLDINTGAISLVI